MSKDTRFKPGKSGNPNGRPPGHRSLTTYLKEQKDRLAKDVPALMEVRIIYNKGGFEQERRPSILESTGLDPKTATVGEVLACSEFIHGILGSGPHAAQIHDRTEGKVKQDFGVEQIGPLVVVVEGEGEKE
jgi:hypothetical protein